MIQKKVGLRIREIRHSKKLSQEECAFNIEIDRTYLSSVECGQRNISIVNLNKICKSFEISLKDFFNSDIFEEE